MVESHKRALGLKRHSAHSSWVKKKFGKVTSQWWRAQVDVCGSCSCLHPVPSVLPLTVPAGANGRRHFRLLGTHRRRQFPSIAGVPGLGSQTTSCFRSGSNSALFKKPKRCFCALRSRLAFSTICFTRSLADWKSRIDRAETLLPHCVLHLYPIFLALRFAVPVLRSLTPTPCALRNLLQFSDIQHTPDSENGIL